MSKLEEVLSLSIQFEKRGGLVPVIVQDIATLEVLMLGYANELAIHETLHSGYATFWSTSRNELWTKGKTSGDLLSVEKILIDCDQDTLLYQVRPEGKGACHTHNRNHETRRSCFYRTVNESGELSFIPDME